MKVRILGLGLAWLLALTACASEGSGVEAGNAKPKKTTKAVSRRSKGIAGLLESRGHASWVGPEGPEGWRVSLWWSKSGRPLFELIWHRGGRELGYARWLHGAYTVAVTQSHNMSEPSRQIYRIDAGQDPRRIRFSWVEAPVSEFGLDPSQVHSLGTGTLDDPN